MIRAKQPQQTQRQHRIRTKLRRNPERVRLSVHRSNRYVYAQIIDDVTGTTIVSVSERTLQGAGSRMESARQVGVEIAKKAKEKKVTAVVFDKGAYAYHGRVKAIAEGAREGGLVF